MTQKSPASLSDEQLAAIMRRMRNGEVNPEVVVPSDEPSEAVLPFPSVAEIEELQRNCLRLTLTNIDQMIEMPVAEKSWFAQSDTLCLVQGTYTEWLKQTSGGSSQATTYPNGSLKHRTVQMLRTDSNTRVPTLLFHTAPNASNEAILEWRPRHLISENQPDALVEAMSANPPERKYAVVRGIQWLKFFAHTGKNTSETWQPMPLPYWMQNVSKMFTSGNYQWRVDLNTPIVLPPEYVKHLSQTEEAIDTPHGFPSVIARAVHGVDNEMRASIPMHLITKAHKGQMPTKEGGTKEVWSIATPWGDVTLGETEAEVNHRVQRELSHMMRFTLEVPLSYVR